MESLTEMSSEEIEERLKNAQYQIVLPLKLRKSSETSQRNKEEPSKKETKKKE
jgi:hypothetical protein